MGEPKIISTRVSSELAEALDHVAHERGQKRGTVVREALEFYLNEWAEYSVALARLKDPLDEVLGENEFLSELGWKI